MERKYSVSEIDKMRKAISTKVWAGVRIVWSADMGGRSWQSEPSVEERAALRARVEDELRTYMLNGTDPEELSCPTQPEGK